MYIHTRMNMRFESMSPSKPSTLSFASSPSPSPSPLKMVTADAAGGEAGVLCRTVRMAVLAESQMIRARRALARALHIADEKDARLHALRGGGGGGGGGGSVDSTNGGGESEMTSFRTMMLVEAARCGSVVAIEMFLQDTGGASTSINRHQDLLTALHSSIVNGHDDVSLALVHSGQVDVNATVNVGATLGLSALHLACHSGTPTSVRVLIAHGASISLVAGFHGGEVLKTPLDIAKERGRLDIVDALESAAHAHDDDSLGQMKSEMTEAYERNARDTLIPRVQWFSSSDESDQRHSRHRRHSSGRRRRHRRRRHELGNDEDDEIDEDRDTDETFGAIVSQQQMIQATYPPGFPIESAVVALADRVSKLQWADIQIIAVAACVVISIALTLLEAASMESSDVAFSSRVPT